MDTRQEFKPQFSPVFPIGLPRTITEIKNLNLNLGCPPCWETPEEFIQSAIEYKDFCDNNPIKVDGVYGKDPTNVTFDRPRITTIAGFCVYCKTTTVTFFSFEKRPDFLNAVSFARILFTSNNIELASAGVANMNIVSRVEGLVDKKEIKSETTQTVFFEVPRIEQPTQNLIEGDDWGQL